MKHSHAARRGVTLVEVLLALVILSIGVSTLMVAMSRCLGVVRTARNRETAHRLIRRVNIEFPIENVDMVDQEESGDFEEYPGYTWHRTILMENEEDRPGLFLVTTRIQWPERNRWASEEITVYRYAPDAEALTKEF